MELDLDETITLRALATGAPCPYADIGRMVPVARRLEGKGLVRVKESANSFSVQITGDGAQFAVSDEGGMVLGLSMKQRSKMVSNLIAHGAAMASLVLLTIALAVAVMLKLAHVL